MCHELFLMAEHILIVEQRLKEVGNDVHDLKQGAAETEEGTNFHFLQ